MNLTRYEAARHETVLSIAAWVKEHPRATQVRDSQAGVFTFTSHCIV